MTLDKVNGVPFLSPPHRPRRRRPSYSVIKVSSRSLGGGRSSSASSAAWAPQAAPPAAQAHQEVLAPRAPLVIPALRPPRSAPAPRAPWAAPAQPWRGIDLGENGVVFGAKFQNVDENEEEGEKEALYLAIDLNWGYLVGVLKGKPSSIGSYFFDIDCDICPNRFRRQLSFDSTYVFRDQNIFPK